MKRIILASASPRRRELLQQIGLEFEVIPAKGEEIITKVLPADVVKELSYQKAKEVADKITDGIVIGADTIVCKEDVIMGKPSDTEEAHGMLKSIQGTDHSVFTGVTICVIEDGKAAYHSFAKETKVFLFEMSDEEIDAYIATGDPMDKAGAYGIQGRFAAWVKGIEGDYNNVVGLPVSAVYQEIKKYL